MPILLYFCLFIISVIVLVKAADFFTDNAIKLGQILRFSPFLVGVVIVAIGTSLPELTTSIIATVKGQTEIVVADVLGSDIANILLALGIVTLVTKNVFKAKWDIFYGDLPLFVAALLLGFFIMIDGEINFIEACMLLAGFLIYIFYLKGIKHTFTHEIKKTTKFEWKIPIIVTISLIAIILSANYTIEAILNLARLLNFKSEVLAASLIAIGTSLPEIMVAISAAKKKQFDLISGNIIGSNIFNLTVVTGASGLIKPLTVSPQMITFVYPFLIGTSLFYWVTLKDKHILKSEGAFMILLYIFFIAKLYHFI